MITSMVPSSGQPDRADRLLVVDHDGVGGRRGSETANPQPRNAAEGLTCVPNARNSSFDRRSHTGRKRHLSCAFASPWLRATLPAHPAGTRTLQISKWYHCTTPREQLQGHVAITTACAKSVVGGVWGGEASPNIRSRPSQRGFAALGW